MEQIVKEYLEKAQSKERQIFEKERDDLLVKLGLTKDVVREYTELNYYSVDYPNWDPEKRKYYSEKPIPVEVSDEEYEEIKKYAKLSLPKEDVVEIFKDDVLDNGAESFLGGVNAVMLVVSIIVAIALFFSSLSEIGDGGGYIILGAILLILLSVISFYSVKVILNISNNLHKINAKQYRLSQGILLEYSTTGGYMVPMIIFASFGVLAFIMSFFLKMEDRKKGYGLELPNIRKQFQSSTGL